MKITTMFAIWITVAAVLVAFTVWWTKSAFPLWLMVPFFFFRIRSEASGTGENPHG